MRHTFETWKAAVDKIIAARLYGLTADDLPDCPYRRWYEAKLSPREAASRAIKTAREF